MPKLSAGQVGWWPQVLSASCAVREPIVRLSAFGGLGHPAPFGDRSARFAKLLANDFRVVLSIGVDPCTGGMSAVTLRCLIAG